MQPAISRVFLVVLFALLSVVLVTSNDANMGNETSSPAPSFAPSANATVSPAPTTHNATVSPAPTTHNETVSPAPTVSAAPTTHNETVSPAPSYAPTPHNETESPSPTHAPNTTSPTHAPTAVPDDDHHHHGHHYHWWRILFKTIAWMIVAGLSVLAFGACMSNRYRIYYYLRGSWYRFLRMDCTQWILRKTRLDGYFFGGRSSSSLNDIIFEGGGGASDLHEGLLMRETIG